MDDEIQHLLDIRAIKPVPENEKRMGFYSILFLFQKVQGDGEDLESQAIKLLYIVQVIQDAIPKVNLGMHTAGRSLAVNPAHCKYLRFAYANCHYQYWAMPFGLSSAPRTFTKLLAVITAAVCMVPVHILCYLEDILILSSNPSQAVANAEGVTHAFQHHGFTINLAKSHLHPTTFFTLEQ